METIVVEVIRKMEVDDLSEGAAKEWGRGEIARAARLLVRKMQ